MLLSLKKFMETKDRGIVDKEADVPGKGLGKKPDLWNLKLEYLH